MKKPKWPIIIGILLMMFGCLGIIRAPENLDINLNSEIDLDIVESINEVTKSPDTAERIRDFEIPEGTLNELSNGFQVPAWYKSWAIFITLASVFIAAAYFLSGLLLIVRARFAVEVFYAVISMSIVWAIFHILICLQTGNAMIMSQIPISMFSILIDIIIFLIVILGSKDGFGKK